MSQYQIIVYATPVFLLLIAIEFAYGLAKGRNTYRLDDAISSIALGMLSEVTKVFTLLLRVGIYAAVFETLALWRNDGFWMAWYGWVLALVFYDFCYYWLHRLGHESAVLWAAHVVHHQSQDYNLSTALRQTSSGALLGWVFYVPMALAGVPPLVFGIVAMVDLLYQFWVHTEHVPKLGWFDRVFVSPSNHRVHHAVNDRYLDRNYGGILIVWDRIFGSFEEESEKCIYGTRSPLQSWDPLWANAEVYWALMKDSWHAKSWADKLRVWIKPPGWRPADVAERFPKPAFDIAKVTRYEPQMTKQMAGFAAIQFTAMLFGATAFLWNAEGMPLPHAAVWVGVFALSLWALAAAMQGRIAMVEVLLLEAAALATATAAVGMTDLHRWLKPLVMVIAIGFVLHRGRVQWLLVGALVFSLVGDVLLPGRFIPGLVAFLIAHLCYIALFRRDAPWFASRKALAGTLAAAVVMYAILFPHLPPVLKVAVAAYALVIASMAAQAIGRASVLRDQHAAGVAIGAVVFMLSDSILAINKFAVRIPMQEFWVLATYYAAQVLIVHNARAHAPVAQSPNSSPALFGGATPR
ncbi:lysoplasmalogenase family protein [Ramlibacter sp. PS4R-6]|uniref:lysoplasmalogenase family protein n=1 Tax=Ramlibacter sp. PS4R-6 TaxID=3133438 RepID=UPI0030A77076